MRVILDHKDSIRRDQVDSDHIVLLKADGAWFILTPISYGSEVMKANRVDEGFNIGDGLNSNGEDSHKIQKWFDHAFLEEAHAFDTFKEACEFLITVL